MKSSYTFWEIMDWDWLRDAAEDVFDSGHSPISEIAGVILHIIRIIMLLLTIGIALALMVGCVVGILGLITSGNTAYAIIGIVIAYVALNTGAFLSAYKWGQRKGWYFWISFIPSTIAAIYVIIELVKEM